jgi:hypothetical protein
MQKYYDLGCQINSDCPRSTACIRGLCVYIRRKAVRDDDTAEIPLESDESVVRPIDPGNEEFSTIEDK